MRLHHQPEGQLSFKCIDVTEGFRPRNVTLLSETARAQSYQAMT